MQAKSHIRYHQKSQWKGWVICLVVVLALRISTLYASRLLEYAPYASLWFPATAVTFSSFAVFRWRALPILALANVFGSLAASTRQDLYLDLPSILMDGLSYSIVHCAAYCVLADSVLRSIAKQQEPSLVKTIRVFLVGGLFASMIAAVGGAAVICTFGTVPDCAPVASAVIPWLIGDYVGLVTLGPLMLFGLRLLAAHTKTPFPDELLAFDDTPRLHEGDGAFVWKLVLSLSAVSAVLFAMSSRPDYQPIIALVFMIVVIQLWMVHAQTVLQSLVSIGLFGLTLVVIAARLQLQGQALLLQCAMITLATGSYLCISVPLLYAQNKKLRSLIIRDSMTGTFTRYFFVELSEQSIRRAAVSGAPTSMLMLDLDLLKAINDHYGHKAGDQALSHVADIVSGNLRSSDLFGRLGGDEFCIVLPGVDALRSAEMAERLLAAVRSSEYPFTSEMKPSISIGLATTMSTAEDYDSLWLRADSALYVAKRGGRGRLARDDCS